MIARPYDAEEHGGDYWTGDAQTVKDCKIRASDWLGDAWGTAWDNLGRFAAFTLLIFIIELITSNAPNKPVFYPFQIAIFLLTPHFMAGYWGASFAAVSGRRPKLEDFFIGFDHFGQLLAFGIAANLVVGSLAALGTTGIFYGLKLKASGQLLPAAALVTIGTLVAIVPTIYFWVAWSLSTGLIIDRKYSWWRAMQTSRAIVERRFFSMLGYKMLAGLIASLGVLVCCLGLLVTVPASLCMMPMAFNGILGLKRRDYGELA